MTTSLYVERSQDRWLANAFELGGGWFERRKRPLFNQLDFL